MSARARALHRMATTVAWLACLTAIGCGDDDGPTTDASVGADVNATDGDAARPDAGPSRCYELDDGRCVEETFVNPPVLAPDDDGVYHLDLGPTEVELDGHRHCVRAYNGSFIAPTIETAARVGSTPRSVRVDLANRLEGHDLRSLEGGACTCQMASGAACVPEHLHDRCLPATGGDPCTCTNEDGEPCEHMFDFNVTNLHAHGSHVRPDYARGGAPCEAVTRDGVTLGCRECGDDVCGATDDDTCFHGDDVLNVVMPRVGARYRWDIDEDGTHHTGLQWYHPHIHGTTAIQVVSGAAGAWIIRGELDALDGVANARERVIVLSTPPIANDDGFPELADGDVCDESTITFNDFATLGAIGASQLNIVNGVSRPRMITAPGQVERWRILHTAFLDEVFLGLFRGSDGDCSSWSTDDADTIQLTQIGRDGLILPRRFEHPYVFMSPGYRVEAMLGGEGQLDDGETWCLVAARFLQDADPTLGGRAGEPFSPLDPPTMAEVFARFDSGSLVAILNVTAAAGPATETSLPDYDAIAALAPPLELDGVSAEARCTAAAAEDVADVDQAAMLQVGFWTADDPDPCGCPNYNVNCRNFEDTDRAVYPFDRDLRLDAIEHWRIAASFDGHPFHIHINPFIVCPNDNIFDPLPFPHWRDTYLVNIGRTVDLVTQNRAFTGPYVFHCHKLTHEDHGMMELVRVCDPAEDPTCGDYHWRYCAEGDDDCLRARAATQCTLEANGPLEIAMCPAMLAAPGAACDPNVCATDDDCPDLARCDASSCVPAPCVPPCAPGRACVHGTCA